jgi:hypothetical protein
VGRGVRSPSRPTSGARKAALRIVGSSPRTCAPGWLSASWPGGIGWGGAGAVGLGARTGGRPAMCRTLRPGIYAPPNRGNLPGVESLTCSDWSHERRQTRTGVNRSSLETTTSRVGRAADQDVPLQEYKPKVPLLHWL